MNIQELPQEIQEYLLEERTHLHEKCVNNAYNILLYSQDGTRYFRARRVQQAWCKNGKFMPFGGGSSWLCSYGAVQWNTRSNSLLGREYFWEFGKKYTKSSNGTIVTPQVATKKEAICIAKKIGIFNI